MDTKQKSDINSSCQIDFTSLLEAATLIENDEANEMEIFDGIASRRNPASDPAYPVGTLIASFEFQCLANLLSSIVLYEHIHVPTSGLFFEELDRRFAYLEQERRSLLTNRGVFVALKNSVQIIKPLFEEGYLHKTTLSNTEADEMSKFFDNLLHKEGGSTLAKLALDFRGTPWYEQIRSLPHKSLLKRGGIPFTDGIEFESYFSHRQLLEEAWTKSLADSGTQSFGMQGIFDAVFFFQRGFFYNEIAKLRNTPYLSHPLRMPVVLGDSLSQQIYSTQWSTAIVNWARDTRNFIVSARNKEIGTSFYEIDLPPFADIVLKMSPTKDAIIRTCLEIRKTREATNFRRWLAEITSAALENRGEVIQQAVNQLKTLRQSLMKEFGLNDDKVTTTLGIFSYDVTIPSYLHRARILRPKHTQFLYDYVRRSQNMLSLRSEIERLWGTGYTTSGRRIERWLGD